MVEERDQGLYRVAVNEPEVGAVTVFKNDILLNTVITYGDLAKLLLRDYLFDLGYRKLPQRRIGELGGILFEINQNRASGIDGYIVCGLTIKEFINGRKGSKAV